MTGNWNGTFANLEPKFLKNITLTNPANLDDFYFAILEVIDGENQKSYRDKKELWWINVIGTVNNSYNSDKEKQTKIDWEK